MSEQELMMEKQTQEQEIPEVQSEKELKLIQELVSIRKESNRSVEYETLDEYRMPPGTHFAMLKKPAVSIKYGRLTFNMAAIRMFEGTVNILPMLHEGKHRLAAVPCTEEESASVEWARKTKQGKWANKEIRSVEFVKSIFDLMGWDPTCRYKVLGRIVNSDRGLIFVFDLDVNICYEKGKETYVDPVTGRSKQRQKMHYNDNFDGHVGRRYNDYEAARKLNQFEDTGEYIDGESVEGSAASDNLSENNTAPDYKHEEHGVVTGSQQQTIFDQALYQGYRAREDESGPEQYPDYYAATGND